LTVVSPEAAPARDGAWLEAWQEAVAFGWESLAKLTALYDPRRLRSLWLADVRQLATDALRSPQFLALAKFNLSLLARRTTPPSAP
jgi:hypothetical protein